MAKKTKKKIKKAPIDEVSENRLPQNILPVGEHVEENKNIYISQSVYKEVHKFTKNKTTNESGGMLVGTVIEEFGKSNIVISGFVEAKHCEATPTTLKFTHDTWDYVHKEIAKKHKGKKIVGWIHTHPDFGIFLSDYDKFIHQNFFNDEHQIAYVVDPIKNIEGFYFWVNGNIEKCKGFYIYDKTDTQITVDIEKDEPAKEKAAEPLLSIQNLLFLLLSAVVVFLIFSNISTNKQLKQLEKEQEKLTAQQTMLASSANQALSQMQQTINSQKTEIQKLLDILKDAGILLEPETPTTPNGDPSGNEDPNPGGTDDPTGETTGTTATDPVGTTATDPVGTTATDPVGTTATDPVGTTATDPVGTTEGNTTANE